MGYGSRDQECCSGSCGTMPVTSALWEAEAALTVPACGFYFCLHVRLEHFYGKPLSVLQYVCTV